MVDSTVKALMDLSSRSLHYRQGLDACISHIARLQSYATSQTKRTDDPIKIRQDLLATHDIADLALHLRRFAEITQNTAIMRGISLTTRFWKEDHTFEAIDASLYDIVSRLIHSKTCAVCRNLAHVFMHFGSRPPSKEVRDGPLGVLPILVIESDKEQKTFLFLKDFLESAYKIIDAVAQRDEEVKKYLNRRWV